MAVVFVSLIAKSMIAVHLRCTLILYEGIVSDKAGLVFFFSFGSASDSGRLMKRCSGWLHVAAANVVCSSISLTCFVELIQT